MSVKKHPDRYGAFALLPWSDPVAAVNEAQRVKDMGFQGILLSGRASGGDEFPRLQLIAGHCHFLLLPMRLLMKKLRNLSRLEMLKYYLALSGSETFIIFNTIFIDYGTKR